MAVSGTNLWAVSDQFFGTSSGWQPITLQFDTGACTTISIQCRLGDGYEFASGTVWFDDLTLVELP